MGACSKMRVGERHVYFILCPASSFIWVLIVSTLCDCATCHCASRCIKSSSERMVSVLMGSDKISSNGCQRVGSRSVNIRQQCYRNVHILSNCPGRHLFLGKDFTPLSGFEDESLPLCPITVSSSDIATISIAGVSK